MQDELVIMPTECQFSFIPETTHHHHYLSELAADVDDGEAMKLSVLLHWRMSLTTWRSYSRTSKHVAVDTSRLLLLNCECGCTPIRESVAFVVTTTVLRCSGVHAPRRSVVCRYRAPRPVSPKCSRVGLCPCLASVLAFNVHTTCVNSELYSLELPTRYATFPAFGITRLRPSLRSLDIEDKFIAKVYHHHLMTAPSGCQPSDRVDWHESPLSSAGQHLSYGDCLEVKREYYQNCSVLGCVIHTMFTVSSTLMWAVLTGPADWVCHIGTFTPCIEAVA